MHYLARTKAAAVNAVADFIREIPIRKTLVNRGEARVLQGRQSRMGKRFWRPSGFLALAGSTDVLKSKKPRFSGSGFTRLKCYTSCHPKAGRVRALLLESFDESYVERLRAGDFRTQEHFVAYFSQLMQLKLRSRLNSAQAIEDVRQETFTRVFAALRSGKIRQPERLGAFVNSMCNNVLLEHYRSSSRSSSLEDEEQQDFPALGIDIVGTIANRQIAEKVREILEGMPERDRRLIREIFLEERDKDEVCRDFGVDRDYLRVLLHRAKQSFKTLYLKSMATPAGSAASAKL